MSIEPGEICVDVIEDKPARGMWHCGPNPAWVTVTHLPTGISARMYDASQWKAREAARLCVELMLEQSRMTACSFPERLEEGRA